jgi:hypothetical protein
MINKVGKLLVTIVLIFSAVSIMGFAGALIIVAEIPLDGNLKMWHVLLTTAFAGTACFQTIVSIWNDKTKTNIHFGGRQEINQTFTLDSQNDDSCADWIHDERVNNNDDIYCPICGEKLQ